MDAGFVVAERFTIEQRAGSGGMATVWRAVDRATGDLVALKLIGPVAERERFLREAEMLANLDHPNIVHYIAHGELEDGTAFLAMEWLDGQSLAARLQQGPLPLDESLALCSIVARALGHAHARGIIHRDVKPSNVMLPSTGLIGEARVLDFGIARRGMRRDLTRTGMLVGTPGYMAPEQARGARDVDARADVFALGCLLYKCLTQKAPFGGESVVAVLAKVLLEEPTPLRRLLPDVPEHVERLVARLLAKDPKARPADGAEAAELFTRALRGESLWPPSQPAPRTLTALEQRMISVLLLDAGSGQADEPRDEDLDATATITPLPSEVASCAASYGAQIEPLAEGSFLLTWQGAGLEHATRAARCAIALAEIVPNSLGVLGTGRAVVGGAGVPVGEIVDRIVALRDRAMGVLVAAQAASTVLLDPVSAMLLEGRFTVIARGELSLLGPERDAVETVRTLLGKPTPCVGREREIDQLMALFEECVDEASPRAVLLKAPAGYGKSRVRYELLARLRGAAQVWMGRGDPMSAGAPFELFTQALRRAYAIRDDDPIEARREKLGARVARHFDDAARRGVVEFVGEMIGVRGGEPGRDDPRLSAALQDPVLMGDQIRAAVVSLLRAECRDLPLVLVLEDLHWGDIPTVKLVDALMRDLQNSPLFVLATARPEIDEQFPKLWEERSVLVLPLRELGRKPAEQLVRAALPDAGDARVAALVQRAAGNAFHLEELIRAVAEDGSDVLPETVLATVAARFDRLDAEARRVLRAASVFGQAFWASGVAAMVGHADVAAHLAALVSQELVQPRPEGRFERGGEYVFRNSSIREAAYATLTEHDRATGHRLAAAWLEAAGETGALVLAEHLERGGEPARAVPYWERAAEQAMEGNDLSRALELAARGLACAPAPAAAARLLVIRSDALRWRGELRGAVEEARRAADLAQEGCSVWFHAVSQLAQASLAIGDLDAVTRVAERLCAITPLPADLDACLAALSRVALSLTYGTPPALAQRVHDRMDELLADAKPSDATLARVHLSSATRAMRLHEDKSSLACFAAALACFERAGDRRGALFAQASVGAIQMELGQFARAGEMLRATAAAASEIGMAAVANATRARLGLALAYRDELPAARAELAAALAACKATGDVRTTGVARTYLALAELRSGDLEAAERHAHAAAEVLASIPSARADALAALSRALLALGRAAEALEASSSAIAVLRELGSVDDGEVRARLAHVEALAASGRRDEAAALASETADGLRARAAKLEAALGASLLEGVPENARVLDLARALTKDAPAPG